MSDSSRSPASLAEEQIDGGLAVGELVEVAAHCARVRAAADYRMLQVVSRIHEQREDEYIAEVAAYADMHPPSESASLADVLGPREKYGLNGLERAIADVGAALCVPPQRARKLVATASAMRYRLPQTGYALADGVIDLDRLMIAVARTDLVAYEAIRDLDLDLADQLQARGRMSTQRFQTLVDQLIHRYDPDALARRRGRVDDDRHITIGPDRFTAGQARISGTLPQDQAAAVNARLDAMAKEIHKGDGRTLKQLRADAYVALAHGQQHLDCGCEACTATNADTKNPDAEASSGCAHRTQPYLHIVVNLTSLLGIDNDPAYLDGQGLIDADTARALLAEAKRTYVSPPQPDSSDNTRYRPSRKLRALIQAGELCCQFPGCNNPVSQADLDHHLAFGQGGRTTPSNMGPLCHFHHRAKTFAGWKQYRSLWDSAVFTSPTGHTFIGNAYTGTDLFPALCASIPDRPPEHPTRARFDQHRQEKLSARREAEKRWGEQNPPPY
jgi:hypothetical protein